MPPILGDENPLTGRVRTNSFAPSKTTTVLVMAQTNSTSEKFTYTVSDACAALGIGRTSLYALAKSGELNLVKIAGRTLVPRSELERLTRIDSAPNKPKRAV